MSQASKQALVRVQVRVPLRSWVSVLLTVWVWVWVPEQALLPKWTLARKWEPMGLPTLACMPLWVLAWLLIRTQA